MLRLLAPVALLLHVAAAPSSAQVTIETSKVFYDVGEQIEFTVHNGLDETIHMNSFPFWWILHVETQTHVGPCVGLPVIHSIAPGQSETHGNEQIACWTGEPFVPGLYWVGVTYWTDDFDDSSEASASFCVGFECAATPVSSGVDISSWGSVKSLYR